MKEFVENLRKKADIFEKSGCAVDGIVKDYRESADMIEKLCGNSNIGGFVEKLIERLEYLRKDKYVMVPTVCYVLENVEEIVNQLAEEYNQDSTKKNQGWILCSERLPEDEDIDVIVSTKGVGVTIGLYTKRYGYGMQEGFIAKYGFVTLKNALAWQPLPEPYKPEEKQEEPQTNFYSERFNRVL